MIGVSIYPRKHDLSWTLNNSSYHPHMCVLSTPCGINPLNSNFDFSIRQDDLGSIISFSNIYAIQTNKQNEIRKHILTGGT